MLQTVGGHEREGGAEILKVVVIGNRSLQPVAFPLDGIFHVYGSIGAIGRACYHYVGFGSPFCCPGGKLFACRGFYHGLGEDAVVETEHHIPH